MSESIEKNNKARQPEGVRPELALLKVLWDVTRDNLNDYFATRADVYRSNLVSIKPDIEMHKAYERV
jgi:hypothetical protein